MTYFIIKGQIFTLFLSLNHLTAINFESRVFDYVGGEVGEFRIHELNKGKSLVFKTKKKDFKSNFISFLKDKKYHFNLKYDEALSNKDIDIKEGKACSYYSLIKDSSLYSLFECPKSLLFINKTKKAVRVNELTVSSQKFISKGPPVYLNGKLIYLKGEAL